MQTAHSRHGRRGSRTRLPERRRSQSDGRRTFSNTSSGRGGFRGGRAPRRSGSHSNTAPRRGRKMPTFDPSQFINRNPVDAAPEVYTPKHTFDTFGLDPRIAKNVAMRGIKAPTPIQDQIIPEILKDRDVIGLAETGTGKTAAFLVPLIQKTLHARGRQTLILAPTRELALQIDAELKTLAAGFPIFSVICVGGVNINPQIRALRRHNHFVIGTPGRVLDLIRQKHFKPARVATVVLDEADRMLDMGFIRDMRAILSETPNTRETLLFSATITEDAQKLVHDFLRDPVTVSVKKKDVTNSIEQDVVRYDHNSKFETLVALLQNEELKRVIIFGSMKHSVQKLAKQLSGAGVRAEAIHGNKSHGQRQEALRRFKSGGIL